MNNGQLNIASMQTVTQLVTQDQAVPVAVTADGAEQNGGNFAGVLSGVQQVAQSNTAPDSGQLGQVALKIGESKQIYDVAVEMAAADLLAQLNVSPGIVAVSESAASKQGEAKKEIASTETVPARNETSDIASQMAMVAYLQTGRMPEVTTPTPLAADGQQNAATASTSVIAAPSDSISSGHVVTEPLPVPVVTTPVQQRVTGKELSPVSSLTQAPSDRMSEVNKPTALPVDELQNVASASEQASALSSLESKRQPAEHAVEQSMQVPRVISSVPRGPVKESASAPSSQPVVSDKTSDVNNPTTTSVDKLQNVAGVTNTPVMLSAQTDTSKEEQTPVESVQMISTEKMVAPSETRQTERPSAYSTASVQMSSPESKVEIQLSQPQPIAAKVAAEPAIAAVTANRTAGLAHEIRGGNQRVTIEQQIEKVRANNEPGAVNETSSALLSATGSESALGSDISGGSDDGQGQHDSTSDNQMLAQQMRGQLSTDHQKVADLSGKPVSTEPVKQELSEQVMQQVKDRLVQHDVKPGNQQITLTLSPDSLGELKMNLNLQGQKLSVEIVTENRMVRDVIAQHTDTLKESLARQNITMESFDVTSGGKGSGNQGQGQNQNAWRELAQQQQQQLWASPRGYHTARADLPSGQAAYQRQQGHSMLDIHY